VIVQSTEANNFTKRFVRAEYIARNYPPESDTAYNSIMATKLDLRGCYYLLHNAI